MSDFADSPLPEKLSPSRVKDFLQCPRLFYYKSILKMPTPPTEATARGTAAHYAFEHIFNHPRGERTPEAAVAYVRPAWDVMVNPFKSADDVEPGSPEASIRDAEKAYDHLHPEDSFSRKRMAENAEAYRALMEAGSVEEETFLTGTETIVRAWFGMENPNKFDPTDREKYVIAQVKGATVHGFIDRYDVMEGPQGTKSYVSDYKTGKVPKPRYEDDAFFQLEVYAMLLEQITGQAPYQLRLLYVKEGSPDAVLTRLVTPQMLAKTRAKIDTVWKAMQKHAADDHWPTRRQVLCDWCYFKDICPEFHPELDGLPVAP